MRTEFHMIIPALALLAACSSGEPAAAPETPEAQQAEMVENAVRRSYEDRGAEVTDITMARSADGTRFSGRATVRDGDGNVIDVDCSYTLGPGGEPSLECNRGSGEEDVPVVAPSGG
ncbi:MAG: hypothetical protein LC634_01055 [Sphingomonadales bacterium]|nr:hypothetical protein [Sphingomonadales bacterium]